MADNELANVLGHRQRAIAGTSTAHLQTRIDPNVKYAHPYPELEKEYTREQCHKLEELFAEADTDSSGFITLDKFKKFCEKKMGRPITHLDAKKIIRLGDDDEDKKWNLSEFMHLWLKIAAGQGPPDSGMDAVMDANDIRPDISKNPNFTEANTKAGSMKNRFEQMAIADDQKQKHDETIRDEHHKLRKRQAEEREAQRKLDERHAAMKKRGNMFENK